MLLLVRCGAALDSRLWPTDGGVRGRELEPEMFLRESAEARPVVNGRHTENQS